MIVKRKFLAAVGNQTLIVQYVAGAILYRLICVTLDNNGNDDDDDGDNNNEVFLFIKIRVCSGEHAYEKCGLTQT